MLKELEIERIPCYCWFLCLLKLVKADSLSRCLMRWAEEMLPENRKGVTVSLDGKPVRSTGKMDSYDSPLHIIASEIMEKGLEAELDDELGYSKYDYKNKDTDNSRNGHSSKRLRTSFGDVEVSVPRDREGEFEPQVLKKNQTSISQDIEEKILSMYAKGMTTGDIETHIQEIYGISVSDSTVSRITDKILPVAREWQQRPPGIHLRLCVLQGPEGPYGRFEGALCSRR